MYPYTPHNFNQELTVPLCRYAQLMAYPEGAFFGVLNAAESTYSCIKPWTHKQRLAIFNALLEAQTQMGDMINFKMIPAWIVGERCRSDIETIVTKKPNILGLGVKATTLISAGLALSHTTDPATASVAVTFTDTDEVRIYHPGTDVRIYPSSLSITAGTLSIAIPRARAVKTSLEETPVLGLTYATTANFEATIDVYREYATITNPVTYVEVDETTDPATITTALGNGYVRNAQLGIIDIDAVSGISITPDYAEISYKVGIEITSKIENAVVRFAHTLMSIEPVDCDYMVAEWLDAKTPYDPKYSTPAQKECIFGANKGAWQAWEVCRIIARDMYRGSII